MTYGLSEETVGKMTCVFTQFPEIEQVIIYGSRAKGTHREGSDIDITLIGNEVTEAIRSKVWLALDDLNMPYMIDLSVFNSLTSQSLIDHITRVGKSLYQRTGAKEIKEM
ncbi:MAG: nucleotidyltransferase domain-containing protein [Chloroherpetonaceae bacterium]|nr:nucleotidyltransferase domain-containing protein [Chloroherpetonaceae bacterium]